MIRMRRFPWLHRTLTTLPVLWLVLSVVFLLIHLVPGDPIVQMLGEGATATDVSALRHSYDLDLPAPCAVLALPDGRPAWESWTLPAAA